LVEDRGRLAKAPSRLGGSDRSAQGQLSHDRFGANRAPCQKDAGIAQLFGKAQAIYREIGKELNDVPLTGGGSDGNFTAALGIPTLDGLGADGKGAHAACESRGRHARTSWSRS
jgi:acetylornithine deacetylase/succinyl-diaminopimelate desuccinylase-like protein